MRLFILIGLLIVAPTRLNAADPVLELNVGDTSYVGCAVAHDDNVCWLAHTDGRISRVDVADVTSFRKLSDEFRGMSALEARNQLRGQFGPGWKIVGTGHYLVCTSTENGRHYAQHFEDIYGSFRKYFTMRGFDLPEPRFPLIAIVFANERDFITQCRDDEVGWIPGLLGYYSRSTNRICLFEDHSDYVQFDLPPWRFPFSTDTTSTLSELRLPTRSTHIAWVGNVDATVEASLKDTIVHEATHQLAFNLGLHSRIGDPPKWMVEGLATMFEAEGTRRNTGGSAAQRINEERFWWFNQYRQQRRRSGSLGVLVSLEDVPGANILDFYAEAWALTFFLAETRPRQYIEYLRRVAERDPLDDYTPGQRLDDFMSVFGSDLPRLEVDMLRFIDDLQ
jgi:hypothetical protein